MLTFYYLLISLLWHNVVENGLKQCNSYYQSLPSVCILFTIETASVPSSCCSFTSCSGKGVAVFSTRSGAPLSTQVPERASVYSQRGAKGGLDNKNRPLNTVITIQLRSSPLFQFRTLNGFFFFFCLALDYRDQGAFCQIVSFSLVDCLVSVIRCLAGVRGGNDELAFCENQFNAVTESGFSHDVEKKIECT